METAEEPEAITQDEPLEIPDEMVPSSEIQESHVDQHTIPGGIDLMTDLDDLNMKQLVTQAFKEESESQEKTEGSTPETTGDEVAQEPALTMESSAETPSQEKAEPPPADPVPELEMESTPESTPEPAQEEPEPVETVAQEEELEIEPALEVEPELTMESQEATAPSAEQASTSQGSSYDDEAELWANLLPEYEEEAQPVEEAQSVEKETPVAFTEKEEEVAQSVEEEAPVAFAEDEGVEEEPFGGNDFWDQVLEKETQESQTANETETEPQPVSPAPAPVPVAQDTAEREALTDEELWQQAFPGEEELEPTASQTLWRGRRGFPTQSGPPGRWGQRHTERRIERLPGI